MRIQPQRWVLVLALIMSCTSSSSPKKRSWLRICAPIAVAGCVFFASQGGLHEVGRLHALATGEKPTVLKTNHELQGWSCVRPNSYKRSDHPSLTYADSESMIPLAEQSLRASDPAGSVPAVRSLYEAIRWKVNQLTYPVVKDGNARYTREFRETMVRNTKSESVLIEWAWWLSKILAVVEDLDQRTLSPEDIRYFLYAMKSVDYRTLCIRAGIDPLLTIEEVPQAKLSDMLRVVQNLGRERMRAGAIMIASRYQSFDFRTEGLPSHVVPFTYHSVVASCDVFDDWESHSPATWNLDHA